MLLRNILLLWFSCGRLNWFSILVLVWCSTCRFGFPSKHCDYLIFVGDSTCFYCIDFMIIRNSCPKHHHWNSLYYCSFLSILISITPTSVASQQPNYCSGMINDLPSFVLSLVSEMFKVGNQSETNNTFSLFHAHTSASPNRKTDICRIYCPVFCLTSRP